VKAGFLTILILVLGALAANFLLEDNGYVLINFRGYAVEMSVPVLIMTAGLLYMAVRILVRLWRAPRQLGQIAANRRHRKAGEQIIRGYIEMGEGNYARGEKLLTKGVRNSETPLVNYLAAARAAQAQGDIQRRDNWLHMAVEQEPRAAATVLLTQAQLQLDNGENQAARATLDEILVNTPRNPEALRLKAEVCLAEEDWDGMHGLLPGLGRYARVAPEELEDWYVKTWSGLMQQHENDPGQLEQLWKVLPRQYRNHPVLVETHIRSLDKTGQADAAESLARKALNHAWSDDLIRLYGELGGTSADARLKRVEHWLKQRPEDPTLLLVAGRLCVVCELWGKARSYFESGIAIEPTPETWHELGQLLLTMDEADAAANAFQKGLTLSYGGRDLPRLEADD